MCIMQTEVSPGSCCERVTLEQGLIALSRAEMGSWTTDRVEKGTRRTWEGTAKPVCVLRALTSREVFQDIEM